MVNQSSCDCTLGEMGFEMDVILIISATVWWVFLEYRSINKVYNYFSLYFNLIWNISVIDTKYYKIKFNIIMAMII